MLKTGDAFPVFGFRLPEGRTFSPALQAKGPMLIFLLGDDAESYFDLLQIMASSPEVLEKEGVLIFCIRSSDKDMTAASAFRIYEDPQLGAAKLLGTIMSDTKAFSAAFLVDLNGRILESIALSSADVKPDLFFSWLRRLQGDYPLHPAPRHAPILMLSDVFSRDLCHRLVTYYKQQGGSESGFMVEREGKTLGVYDDNKKRRKDCLLQDKDLVKEVKSRIATSLVPMIQKAFAFQATHIERYLIGCYDSENQGFFGMHRDNTTPATRHRRFAVTINLNAEEYEGGELRFPEFGPQTYRALTGGAVVFSCGLFHEAMPVTRGERYCFLPFLYDEASAKLSVPESVVSN